MIAGLNETHHPDALSWVTSANSDACDFPLQNLPYGVFDRGNGPRIGVAIGDQVLDLALASAGDLLEGLSQPLQQSLLRATLNQLMSLGPSHWSTLRKSIFSLLREGSPNAAEAEKLLTPIASVRMLLPAAVGDYTDFYASVDHATNVGALFRPANPLLPNYKWVPIAYHGRASSIVISGTNVRRPVGQIRPDGSDEPRFGPSLRLDFELEVGMYIGPGNALGESIAIGDADEHAFGLCLVNDWSARDIQAWEYQPLGPFLAKNFATSVSPWVVTMEALAPYRVAARQRGSTDPAPLPYLHAVDDQRQGAVHLDLEVFLSSRAMRERGIEPLRVSRVNFSGMYWTFAQMIAHHTSNGCNLRPGDLLASGTVSGLADDSRGCLLELSAPGAPGIHLPSGERRGFLEAGDEVVMRGSCYRPGAARIGFGECRGLVEG